MSHTTFRPTPGRVNEPILKEKREAARSQFRDDREQDSTAAELRERGGEVLRRAGEATRDAGRFIGSRSREGAALAADRSRAGAAQLAETIRRHPMPAMAVGLGLGIVISRLLRRR
jgi:ElaB/YqjD/DUF883 family membrane-anchored ribosome-binding protein